MDEIVVNSMVVARFKFLRFDKFEARNRPHLHILVRYRALKKRHFNEKNN
jgi:hypothetical protein